MRNRLRSLRPCSLRSHRLALLLVLASVGVGAGCFDRTTLPDGIRKRIVEAREGQVMWLKQSMYVGQFWDDDRYDLLSPRQFEEIDALRTVEGDPITPPPAAGIVPVGTRVVIERVEFPVSAVIFRRPIYTPRYATWVFLRVARDRGDVVLERNKRAIMLLPAQLRDDAEFGQWLESALTDEDPNPWLQKLAPDMREGVLSKTAVVGMDYDTLTSAMGFPDRITRDAVVKDGKHQTVEVAIYGATSVVLEDGVVVRISVPKRQPEGATP